MTTKSELRYESDRLRDQIFNQAEEIRRLRDLIETQREWDAIPMSQRGFTVAQEAKARWEAANAEHDRRWKVKRPVAVDLRRARYA